MGNIEEIINKAINLRNSGHLQESNEILVQLAQCNPDNADVSYQCAWSFDVLGKESEAVPYYERTISQGLEKRNLEGALLGLGSTYRTLGRYEKSKTVLLNGIKLFPNNKAFEVFYAMTLYNLREHNQAMEILLKNLADSSSNLDILNYKKAIQFYSDKLDTVWK